MTVLLTWTLVPAALAAGEDVPPLNLPCLDQKPANLDECFLQFLQRNPTDSRQWFQFVKAHADQIYLNQETRQLRIFEPAKRQTRVRYSYRLPQGMNPELPEAEVLRSLHPYVEDKYLLSGGIINWFLLKPQIKGHSDITDAILRDPPYKFAASSRAIVAEGAQDPDFYAWTVDAAHAQTPAHDTGVPKDLADLPNGTNASKSFVEWVGDGVKSVRDFCGEKKLALALYRLGYTLHAIQDLAAHKGRSAAEHSWNESCRDSSCGKTIPEIDDQRNPDEFDPNIDLARAFTRRFLDLVAARLPVCWDELRWYGGPGISIVEKLGEPLRLHWDLKPGTQFGQDFRRSRSGQLADHPVDSKRRGRGCPVRRHRRLDRHRPPVTA